MPDDLKAVRRQLTELQATLDQIARDQQVQFTRIAQLQADIDLLRAAWANIRSTDAQPYAGPDRRKVIRKIGT